MKRSGDEDIMRAVDIKRDTEHSSEGVRLSESVNVVEETIGSIGRSLVVPTQRAHSPKEDRLIIPERQVRQEDAAYNRFSQATGRRTLALTPEIDSDLRVQARHEQAEREEEREHVQILRELQRGRNAPCPARSNIPVKTKARKKWGVDVRTMRTKLYENYQDNIQNVKQNIRVDSELSAELDFLREEYETNLAYMGQLESMQNKAKDNFLEGSRQVKEMYSDPDMLAESLFFLKNELKTQLESVEESILPLISPKSLKQEAICHPPTRMKPPDTISRAYTEIQESAMRRESGIFKSPEPPKKQSMARRPPPKLAPSQASLKPLKSDKEIFREERAEALEKLHESRAKLTETMRLKDREKKIYAKEVERAKERELDPGQLATQLDHLKKQFAKKLAFIKQVPTLKEQERKEYLQECEKLKEEIHDPDLLKEGLKFLEKDHKKKMENIEKSAKSDMPTPPPPEPIPKAAKVCTRPCKAKGGSSRHSVLITEPPENQRKPSRKPAVPTREELLGRPPSGSSMRSAKDDKPKSPPRPQRKPSVPTIEELFGRPSRAASKATIKSRPPSPERPTKKPAVPTREELFGRPVRPASRISLISIPEEPAPKRARKPAVPTREQLFGKPCKPSESRFAITSETVNDSTTGEHSRRIRLSVHKDQLGKAIDEAKRTARKPTCPDEPPVKRARKPPVPSREELLGKPCRAPPSAESTRRQLMPAGTCPDAESSRRFSRPRVSISLEPEVCPKKPAVPTREELFGRPCRKPSKIAVRIDLPPPVRAKKPPVPRLEDLTGRPRRKPSKICVPVEEPPPVYAKKPPVPRREELFGKPCPPASRPSIVIEVKKSTPRKPAVPTREELFGKPCLPASRSSIVIEVREPTPRKPAVPTREELFGKPCPPAPSKIAARIQQQKALKSAAGDGSLKMTLPFPLSGLMDTNKLEEKANCRYLKEIERGRKNILRPKQLEEYINLLREEYKLDLQNIKSLANLREEAKLKYYKDFKNITSVISEDGMMDMLEFYEEEYKGQLDYLEQEYKKKLAHLNEDIEPTAVKRMKKKPEMSKRDKALAYAMHGSVPCAIPQRVQAPPRRVPVEEPDVVKKVDKILPKNVITKKPKPVPKKKKVPMPKLIKKESEKAAKAAAESIKEWKVSEPTGKAVAAKRRYENYLEKLSKKSENNKDILKAVDKNIPVKPSHSLARMEPVNKMMGLKDPRKAKSVLDMARKKSYRIKKKMDKLPPTVAENLKKRGIEQLAVSPLVKEGADGIVKIMMQEEKGLDMKGDPKDIVNLLVPSDTPELSVVGNAVESLSKGVITSIIPTREINTINAHATEEVASTVKQQPPHKFPLESIASKRLKGEKMTVNPKKEVLKAEFLECDIILNSFEVETLFQPRGSAVPNWFAGILTVFPEGSPSVTMHKSPSEVLLKAWQLMKPDYITT